ncbi:ABC transporter permease [Haladaptatus sp. T7]|uniref:ABC transporter permease n=1 Tax=Haladaptatus sp. T7 TaxID=2029368 RepID=UPI0021A254B6|nr:ABC transporter permease [Haladaptatus sp. T7]GKZ12419.1 copper ABC transporter permease [Haladaptatus sp. T7]
MSILVVARKDFEDAVRSKTLWAITALFVLFTSGTVYALNQVMELNNTSALQMLTLPAGLIIPITALVAAYLAIAGERESGSIKLLLGLPHTRLEVLLGKLLGRTAVVTVAIGGAFVVTAGVLAALYGTVSLTDYLSLLLLTALFGAVFVSIAVGISAATATRARAMAAAVGVFVTFQILWDYVPMGIYYLVEGAIPGGGPLPAWYFLVLTLNPKNAYTSASGLFFPKAQATSFAARVIGDPPFYLDAWFGLVVLALWFVLPAALGYLRFQRVDLG